MAKIGDLYRRSVGVVLLNKENKILVAKRLGASYKSTAWQMPQGGVISGETEEQALYREIEEEIGLSKNHLSLVESTKDYYYYNLPERFRRFDRYSNFIGQKQRWFLLHFLGQDSDISVETENPEFICWTWMEPERVQQFSVFFKIKVYNGVLSEFGLISEKTAQSNIEKPTPSRVTLGPGVATYAESKSTTQTDKSKSTKSTSKTDKLAV